MVLWPRTPYVVYVRFNMGNLYIGISIASYSIPGSVFYSPCKIVLLTLAAPRGVTDLHLSWGIHREHARTAYHETCGTEYQQPYRRCNSQTPYFNWNIAQARPMTCLTYHAACKVVFQPPIGRTHSWRFSIFNEINKPLESAPWGSPSGRIFGGVTTATYSYVIPVANLRLLEGETNLLGVTIILDRMFGLIGTYYRGEANFSFCC